MPTKLISATRGTPPAKTAQTPRSRPATAEKSAPLLRPAPTAPKSKAMTPSLGDAAASASGSVSKRALKRPRTDAEEGEAGTETVGRDPKKMKKEKQQEHHEVHPAPPPADVQPLTKRRRGRPAKKTARKHVHFHVDLRGRQIAQWGDGGNFISVVRYLARCVMGTQKFDIRSMTELRHTLGIPYATLMKVVNAPNVADLLVLKKRKKSKQQVAADEKREHVRRLVQEAHKKDSSMTSAALVHYVVNNAPFPVSVPHAFRLVSEDSGLKFKTGKHDAPQSEPSESQSESAE